MSEHMFGVSYERLSRKDAKRIDAIAKRYGAYLVETTLPGRGYMRWFCAENLGSPFDDKRADAVYLALAAAKLGGC